MLSPMQSVSDNAPMARSRSQAGYLPVRQSTNHALCRSPPVLCS